MFHFIALCWSPVSQLQTAAALRLRRALVTRSADWSSVFEQPGLLVLCGGCSVSNRTHLIGGHLGVVVGALFRNADGGMTQPEGAQLSEPESRKIALTSGRCLTDRYWGRYVAFLVDAEDRRTFRVLRDPTGNLPCFRTEVQDVQVFFSHLPDLLPLDPPRFSINSSYLITHAVGGPLLAKGNALDEVSEVSAGQCVEIDQGHVSTRWYWHPATFVQCEKLEHLEGAADSLHRTIHDCVDAWSSCHGRLLHRLSGGLDSSIVLACLAFAPRRSDVTSLTYFIEGGNSDERPYARLAARRAGCEHIELARDWRTNCADAMRASPSATPSRSLAYLEHRAVERRLAAQKGATAIFDGDGGDALFGAAAKHFAAVDYVQQHGLRAPLLRVCMDAAVQLNSSVWSVLRSSIRARFRRPAWDLPQSIVDSRVLTNRELVASTVRGGLGHPWFDELQDAPRGIFAPLLAIVLAEPPYDPLTKPEDDVEHVSALLSQPIVEACLRIPAHVHIDGGRDRAVAPAHLRERFRPRSRPANGRIAVPATLKQFSSGTWSLPASCCSTATWSRSESSIASGWRKR